MHSKPNSRPTKTFWKSFFHPNRMADIHLRIEHFADGDQTGTVTCEAVELFSGTGQAAKDFFHAEVARAHAAYAILRAQVISLRVHAA